MPSRRQRHRLDRRAMLAGLCTGFVLMLLVVLGSFVLDFPRESTGVILFRLVLIYFPTGFVAGARARHANKYAPHMLIPPTLHAFIAGGLLSCLHALLLYAIRGNLGVPLRWLFVEALIAWLCAAIAGLLGDDFVTR